MLDKKLKKLSRKIEKMLSILGIKRNETDWLISLDEENRYLVHGINEYGHGVSNIWDEENGTFLLKDFMPIVQQDKPVIIFGSDGEGYKVFSRKNNSFINSNFYEFGKKYVANRCFIFEDVIVLANHKAQLAILDRETDYSYPMYRYLFGKHFGENKEEVEISVYKKLKNCLLVVPNHVKQCYFYDIKNSELVKVTCL